MASSFDRAERADSPPGLLVPVPPDPRTSGLVYEPFYGLREKPFSLTSDARFFYQSRSHAPAFDDLLQAIRRRESLNVLTGDIGTGKTTLCRAVLESLDRKTFSAFAPRQETTTSFRPSPSTSTIAQPSGVLAVRRVTGPRNVVASEVRAGLR